MHTPMKQAGDWYEIRVAAPAGSVVDFGFLITRDHRGEAVSIWEGNNGHNGQDYQVTLNGGGLVVVQSKHSEAGSP
jgi:hypothetical protein